MSHSAFAFGFLGSPLPHRTLPPIYCAHAQAPQNAKKVSGARLSLQDVPPVLLPPPPAFLPTGTLFHVFRGNPPHLPPAQHSVDGDGYALALTLSPESAFLRGRYIRTRAYLRESRTGQRLYPSRGGTPSTRRYRRLKKACGDGVFAWAGKLFVWGENGLPMWLDPSTLVSRGYSALGAVVTDREELFRERGQALAAPPVSLSDNELALCASGNGGVLFVSTMNEEFKILHRAQPVQLGHDTLILHFAVTETFYVVLCARTVPLSTAAAFRQVLSGATAAADVDAQKGSFVTFVPRSKRGKSVIIELPANSFCFRFARVREEGEGIVLSMLELMEPKSLLSRAQLADLCLADVTAFDPPISVSQFFANPVSQEVQRVENARKTNNQGSVVIRSFSPCAKFAAVVDADRRLAGIASMKGVGVDDVAFAMERGASVSGVVASSDGKSVSALVVDDDGACVRFWNAESIGDGAVYEVELPFSSFGQVPHSCGGVWDDATPKWPEGGKVVKSAYEIFDDRNWNDINSGFSSLGINQ